MAPNEPTTRSTLPKGLWLIHGLILALVVAWLAAVGAYASDDTPTAPPGIPPGDFGKLTPADGTVGLQGTVFLSWQSNPDAVSYEYCIDKIDNNNCNDKWVNVGDQTGVALNDLAYETAYYWQVQAVNGDGTTEADADDWWSFTTGGPIRILLPVIFYRTCPGYNSPWETEDNDNEFTPNGPICFDRTYKGEVKDVEDWFSFEWTGEGTIVVDVVDFASIGQLILYYDNTAAGSLARQSDQADGHYRVTYSAPSAAAGTYLIRLYAPTPGDELYGLEVRQQ